MVGSCTARSSAGLLVSILTMIASFEADVARACTREGMAKGRLRGKQPKLKPRQEAHLVELYRAGVHAVTRLEELFGVTGSTVYRAGGRAVGRGGPTSEGLDAGGGGGSTR